VGNEQTPARNYRLKNATFEILHEAAESYLIQRLLAANIIAEGERIQTLIPRHLHRSELVAEVVREGQSASTRQRHQELNNGRIRKRKSSSKRKQQR
jgi:hypothetical protein